LVSMAVVVGLLSLSGRAESTTDTPASLFDNGPAVIDSDPSNLTCDPATCDAHCESLGFCLGGECNQVGACHCTLPKC
jgi:hypothetical protein